ncbi:MAG: DnaJ domain-containing protein [Bdellovibrionales bacterium]|nr:DnaJ domain-containing protein [Bdellovibrionales bacterium]
MQFQDYYKTLGVDKKATESEIKKAYKKLARKFHPDVNKDPGAEDQFKKITEAYEVLKDPEKRSQYDMLGSNYRQGQDFRPPPGWEQQFRSGAGGGFGFQSAGGFSDFFEMFFGGSQGASPFGAGFAGAGRPQAQKGSDYESQIELSIDDLYHGGSREVGFLVSERGSNGVPQQKKKSYRVQIPPGTTQDSVIRLSGQGEPGRSGGKAGDLKLKVKIIKNENFKLKGTDLETTLKVAPWEAALGSKVAVKTPKGDVNLNIPAGTQSGKKLRLKGLGVKKTKTDNGDLYVKVEILVPDKLSSEEEKLFKQLAEISEFNPRS